MSIGGAGEEQSIGGAGEVITLRSGEEELLTTGTLHTRTLNEVSQRFQNHGEGSYSSPSLMIIVSASQFHIYLPIGLGQYMSV